ncbi:hypothetical protein KRE47_08100 [Elizabethkingia meningoseptica]|uniref:hypothetical protein n=1 Tax=Elizabethkingia meningoseptica TaxID=238 RepID=UPI0023B09278|nr:hypothetical protein [Elizabethkingia meningoseptica]MDE5437599.1 hypothetical protein [Elizabethkingia meningoseptica]MDE5467995.1 hypothetical protein [Elizabethkingia meningoseptica]MDE5474914.1 hypothetical protein [Elizabethkingia meningoseptica]MDE5478347.1 hypothetical protein [Elizabethkingia meningoseptica]MDE5486746.1 hypothetical protein [Elizabethkingia meningoseptica]
MKQLLDLDTFAKTLMDKGYDRYFQTEASYADKLKDSISLFLEACNNGTDKPMLPNIMMLKTYLEWNGDDKPKVECNIWVNLFDVQKMNIDRIDQYGQLLKQSKLTNLSVNSVPTKKEAIAQVSEKLKQLRSSQNTRFRMR